MKIFLSICIGFILLTGPVGVAQTSPSITKEQALACVDWCLNMLDSIHPAMYYYTPKQVVDSVFDELKRKIISQPGDCADKKWLLAELTRCNHLWDCHTTIWPKSFHFDSVKLFPPIRWTEDNRVYLLGEDFRISSVNGVSINDIDGYLGQYSGKDINIKSDYITRTVGPKFQYCLNEHGIFPPYIVCGVDSTGRNVERMIHGMYGQEVSEKRWHETAKIFGFPSNTEGDILWGRREPYQFEIYPEESVAIMRYDEMFFPKSYPNIKKLIHRFFSDCQKHQIKYLFFDISRNTGGVTKSFDILGPYLTFKKNVIYQVKFREKDTTYWVNEQIVKNVNEDVKRFRGQIFVYQSYYTGSASSIFAAVMKVTTNTILVGTAVGQGGIPSLGRSNSYDIPFMDGSLCIPCILEAQEVPQLNRTPEGWLLPDLSYPFLLTRRLDVKDCLKIVELNIKK